MGIAGILAELDEETGRLERARSLLAVGAKRGPGRPKGSATLEKPAKKKRNLSPEGRKRIVEAVKRRWAAQKKAGKG